jgi:hypothetical protein
MIVNWLTYIVSIGELGLYDLISSVDFEEAAKTESVNVNIIHRL